MSRITILFPDNIGEVAASILRSWRCALLLGLIVAISVQCNAAPASEGYDDDGATVFEGNIFVSDGVKYTISGTEVYTSDIRNNGSIGDATNYSLFFDSDGLFGISSVTIEAEDGGSFRLTGLVFDGIADADITIATDAGGSVSYTSNNLLITQAVDASEDAAFYNITSVTISGVNLAIEIDDLGFDTAVLSGPTVTSATYDANTGVLTVTGTDITPDGTIDVSMLTLTGEGGATRTLTSSDVTAASATSFSVTLNVVDRAAVNQLTNKNGTSSTGGTTYNLAAAANWDVTGSAPADLTGNGVTVSNVAAPAITDATYDAYAGTLAVTGTGFLSSSGAMNDIVANKLTLTGEGGATYTLSDTGNTEIISGTSFTVALSATDKAAVNQIINKNGMSSTGGTTYNLAAAEDWAAGAFAAVTVADLTGNGVTVSNIAVPAITSATYNASTGALVVTGTGFLSASGATNDIVANKFTLTGDGGATCTLTDTANVEITSGTSFTLTLSITDRSAVNVILNKNGTSSNGDTTYNLAAGEDWAAGADAAVVVADTTGNGITASKVRPTVTDANISISGASGIGGAFRIGDTVVATWDNTADGDNNAGVTGVTVDFSAFDGDASVAASNSSGTWTATYTIVAGATDATDRNVSITATNADGSTTKADTTNATVDNVAPSVTDSNISISEGSGTDGAFLIGNAVIATWNNGPAGDDNSDTISSVTIDFTDFGGGAAVEAANSSGSWMAYYSITGGTIQAINCNVSVTAVDNAGNATISTGTANAIVDLVTPTVASVSVPADATYGLDDTLDFTVNFSEAVMVNGLDGIPRLALTLDTGGTVYAGYADGSGTSALVFRYTIAAGNGDPNGITVGALDANGGTIKDIGGNNATLTLNSVGSTTGVRIDGVAPTVEGSTVPSDATYASGETLDFTVTYSESVTVNTVGGTPRIELLLDSASPVYASYHSGTGTSTLTFRYTVASGDLDADGITVGSSISLNGGTISDAAGNAAAVTNLGFGSTAGVFLDAVLPAVSSIKRADGNPTSATSVNYTVAFSKNVSGVDATDFTLTATGTAAGTISLLTPVDGKTFTVTVSSISGEGTLRLDLKDAGTGITDTPGNAITTGFSSGETYSFDRTAPSLSTIKRQAPAVVNVDGISATWRVTFNSDVTGVDAADFALTAFNGSSVTGSIASVTPVDASTYDVVVDTLSGQGPVRLDLDASGTAITDVAENALADGGFMTGDIYFIGATSVLDTLSLPYVTSIPVDFAGPDKVAQRFTTGGTDPLSLTSVTAAVRSISGTPAPVVTIRANDAGVPGSVIATLTNPPTLTANTLNVWTGNVLLDPNTVYWIVFAESAEGASYRLDVSTASTGGSGAWLKGADYVFRYGVNASTALSGAIKMAIGATSTSAITSPLTAAGSYGTALTYTATATNTPTGYSATGLPAGLTLNTTTGAITGTPEAAGTFNVVLTATNGSGAGAPSTLVMTIAKVALTVTANDATRAYGEADPTFSLGYTGFVGGDTSADLTTAPSVTTTATAGSAPGTYPITPAGAASSNYTISHVAGSLTVEKATQTISFPSVGSVQPGDTVNLVATSTSGLPVAFTLVSGDATLVGSTLTIDGGGSIVVRASQPGDTNYLSATPVDRTIAADKLDQTITFAALPDRSANDAAFTLTAAASSGLPVSFAVVSGPAMLSGATLTLTGTPGTVVVTASQGGDDTYGAAVSVTQSFDVGAVGPLVFFGSLGSESIAATLGPDGRSGTMIGIIPGTGEGFVVNFSLNPDGTWSATVETYTGGISAPTNNVRGPDARSAMSLASRPKSADRDGLATITRTFRGTLQNGVLSGTIDGLDLEFSAELQPPIGRTSGLAGYYEAPSINSASGATYSIVGTQGQVYVLVITDSTVVGSGGEVASDGSFTVTASQVTIIGNVDASSTSVTGTILLPNGSGEDFSGVRESTLRTDRLINLSTRARITSQSDGVLITGFVVGGTASKQVLLRGVGPSLAAFGLDNALADPRLRLFNAVGEIIAENDNWSGSAELGAAMSRVGAFALTNGSRDAALLVTLAPGAYTMHVLDGGQSGVALAEIYDASPNPSGEYQRLVNISSRGFVEAGNGTLIGGFIVTGNAPKRVLVRGSGPALAAFGLNGVLADPQLAVFNQAGSLIARNGDWENPETVIAAQTSATAAEITAANVKAGAFEFASGSRDAALIVTLAPGIYTAHVTGGGGSSGHALIEIYELAD